MLERLLNMNDEIARAQRFQKVSAALDRHQQDDIAAHTDLLADVREAVVSEFNLGYEEFKAAIDGSADDERSSRAFESWLGHMEHRLAREGYL